MQHQIIQTADGFNTLFLPGINEQYHSLNGAFTESEYVYIDKGFNFHKSKNPTVFEVGFGTGLNCLLTALQAEKDKRQTCFISIEKYPLENEILKQLNYGSKISEPANSIFQKIHSCEWGNKVQISKYFCLNKIKGDLTENNTSVKDKFDLVYFDAFGPDKQPEMWTKSIFDWIYANGSPECVITTYSAKGEVRRGLASAGFSMERLPGPPGKKQMLRGIKNSSNI